jgi:hypothetical protein
MRKIIKLICLAGIILLFGCKDEKNEELSPEATKDVSKNLNISILLDLSDRISPEKYPNPTMEYYLRDVGYINSVYDAFSQHIKGKKIMQMDDKLQLFFDPPPLNPDINSISKSLKIELSKANVSNELLAEIEKKYKSEPLQLYQLAIKDNNYVGSDTWTFFKNRLDDYCIDQEHRNILVILTDGYIYYKNSLMQEDNKSTWLTPERIRKDGLNNSSWSEKFNSEKFGFIKAKNDLSNLEILVLGINPNPNNPYEEDVIKAYWTKWFEDMKVKHYEIRTTDLPSNIDKVIEDFILNHN